MSGPYHTETFDNIPPEKRERILRAAVAILGRDGISGARMGDIARAAGISHGSLFTYFPTKDHLVRAVVAWGSALEGERFGPDESREFSKALNSVFSKAWETASAELGLISLWLSLSLRENARFAEDVFPLEQDAAEKWMALIRRGREDGSITDRVDPRVVAFLVDAAIAQLMKSRASDLERNKFDLFFPGEADPAALIAKGLADLLQGP